MIPQNKLPPYMWALLIGVSLFSGESALAAPPALSLKTISTAQMVSPVAITNAGDGSGRIFVCDQVGQIRIIQDEMLLPTPFLDISSEVVPLTSSYDERGLLSVAFHPGFANPASPGYQKFYIFYSAVSPNAVGNSTPAAVSVGNPCTITTSTAHGLQTGSVVALAGITGGAFSPGINGTYSVTVTGTKTFTVPVNCTSNTGVSFAGSQVYATNPVNCRSTVSEFQVSATNPNVADPTTERVVIAWDKPQMNHNGGQLAFSPIDGYLYITVGDGGSQHDNDYGHTGGSSPGGTGVTLTGTISAGSNTLSVSSASGVKVGMVASGPGLPTATTVTATTSTTITLSANAGTGETSQSFTFGTGNLGNAQDLTKLFGKVLRIDPLGTNGANGSYGIPSDNPFATTGNGVRPEIYTFGMRNPWRLSFDTDPTFGTRLIEGDVGQDNVEEINLLVSGGNYGWRIMEGSFFHDSAAPSAGGTLINPVAEYAHPSTNLVNYPGLTKLGTAVIGGYVYRGSAIPGLVGQFVFADYSANGTGSAGGLLLTADSGTWAISEPTVVSTIPFYTTALGPDESGEIYVATKVSEGPNLAANPLNGTIYKIVPANVATITLSPTQNNTIFSESSALSNALGNIFAGETASGNLRRGLIQFDIADYVPAGAAISSAQLTLILNNTGASTAANMSLYRLSQSWGAGTSGPSNGAGAPATEGDATWGDRFYDPSNPTVWGTTQRPVSGGTHSSTVSATTSVGTTNGPYAWTSSQMASDVQTWLNSPSATNFGWLLVGDETTSMTAREFSGRESAANVQPALQITYATAPGLTWRETWLQTYFSPIGAFVNDTANPSGDGLNNLLDYAFGFSPLVANPPGSGITTTVTSSGGSSTYTMTFLRDPRAVDLTYQLQSSNDLVNWTTIVQSAGGAVPTGSAYVSEAVSPSSAPVQIVTAVETLSATTKHFSRLLVTRSQ
jgi:glucose/arabinose dehydrogenase